MATGIQDIKESEEGILNELSTIENTGDTVWTDGSYNPEDGKAAGAAVFKSTQGRYYFVGRSMEIAKHSTEAELTGTLIASIIGKKYPEIKRMELDSEAAIALLRQPTGEIAFKREDWTLIQETKERLGNIKLKWVKGHANNMGNQKTDEAAGKQRDLLEETDHRTILNLQKKGRFTTLLNGRVMETNMRQLIKRINSKIKTVEVEKGSGSYQEMIKGKSDEQIEIWKKSILALKRRFNSNYLMESVTSYSTK